MSAKISQTCAMRRKSNDVELLQEGRVASNLAGDEALIQELNHLQSSHPRHLAYFLLRPL